MGGVDTWRGVNFQAAFAVTRALDLLEEGHGVSLELEGEEDVVDYCIRGASGESIVTGQAKTRSEPGTWGPQPIVDLIHRWRELPEAERSGRLEFVTDGQLGRESATKLAPALEREGNGQATEEDLAYLRARGLGHEYREILGRVDLRTRQPTSVTLLDLATRRVRRLRDLTTPVDDDTAEHLVLRLHRELAARGEARAIGRRRITRDEIGAFVGVAADVVDHADAWGDALKGELRAACIAEYDARQQRSAALDVEPLAGSTAALRLGELRARERHAIPVGELASRNAVISGPSGAGKSTALATIARHVADAGKTPVLIAPSTVSAELSELVRREVGRRVGRTLAPSSGPAILADPDVVLLVDGLTEIADEGGRRALTGELRDVQSRNPTIGLVVAGRDHAALRQLGVEGWVLRGLQPEDRQAIATSAIGIGGPAAAYEISRSLGNAVENPMLFSMALSLTQTGRPIDSPASIYRGYIRGLYERAGELPDWDADLACLAAAAFDLVAVSAFSIDRWRLLEAFARTARCLLKRGLTAKAHAASASVDRMISAGILRRDPDSDELRFLHDSFRDWFAAEAALRGLRRLPDEPGPEWADTAAFVSSSGEASPEMLRTFVGNPLVAARAGMVERGELTEDLATELLQALLSRHLGPPIGNPHEPMKVRIVGEGDERQAVLVDSTPSSLVIRDAVAGVLVRRDCGSLQAAVRLWLARVRRALRPPAQVPQRPPRDREAIAEAIHQRFGEAQAELDRLIAGICPTIRSEVEAMIGWTGLDAKVLPASADHGAEPTHPFVYTHATNTINVTVGEVHGEGSFGSMTTAEHYLSESAEAKATSALAETLERLLPGLRQP